MVFWFNFSMMWTGITVSYTRVYEQYGWDFLLQPANLFVFCLTVFGLLVVAASFITGGYNAHPSVWYELIGPLHNPNPWVIALVFLGLPLIIYGRMRRET